MKEVCAFIISAFVFLVAGMAWGQERVWAVQAKLWVEKAEQFVRTLR